MGGEPWENGVGVAVVTWEEAGADCLRVRTRVFVEEQGVPLEVEADGRDPGCAHVLARDPTGRPVGTGRLLPDGRIGRMAVLPEWRGKGIGRRILGLLEAEARRRGLRRVTLHAQTRAQGFYEAAGYRVEGGVFEEAGIPHVTMWKDLTA